MTLDGMGIPTARLILRRLRTADAPALFRTVGDPEVMRFWAPGPDGGVAETERRIAAIERHWRTHGFGDWAVVEQATGRLIGFSGLHYIAGMAEVNVGYALEKVKWGQGFGTEACRAVLEVGFRRLELPEIVAVIALQNHASRHLAEKCGLQFWKGFSWLGRDRVAYRIRREEYERRG